DVWEAEAAEAWTEYDAVVLTEQVRLCRASMDAAEHEAVTEIWDRWAADVEALRTWQADLEALGGGDALQSAEVRLDLALAGVQRTDPAPLGASASPLPPLSAGAPLRTAPEGVAARVGEHHPDARRAEAARGVAAARAEHAASERIPWFDFVEVAYAVGSGDGVDRLQLQLAMIIPFGI